MGFYCEDSKAQQYECQATAVTPEGKTINFDVCLGSELKALWSRGVITTGCCCGKHSNCAKDDKGFINIKQDDSIMVDFMINVLKYKYWINEFGTYCFIPKTKLKRQKL